MNVNGIGKQTYYGKANGAKTNARNGSGFYESLSENLNGRMANGAKKENAAHPADAVAGAAYPYRSVAAKTCAAAVYESESAVAVSPCDVRGISYQESDYVKIFAEEGFRLMAQVNTAERCVYIEQKKEDGTVCAYEIDIEKLQEDTANPIEQAALEAWEKKAADGEKEKEDELTLEEALAQFYELIEDRIKNGPPKYLIGNSEFSVAEWDKLIEGIDGQIDAIKEELRERIEKMKEEQLKADMSKDLQNLQDDVREAENEKTEEELLMSLFQDMSKI